MNDRMMREGLDYKWPSKDEVLFAKIDETGGWPNGYKYVGFEHSEDRDAGFCNLPQNDGWWTVVASADDYYMWKLSPEAMKRITDAAVRHFICGLSSNTNPARMHIANYRGYKAVIQAPTAATS